MRAGFPLDEVWEMSPAQVSFVFESKGLLRKRGSISDLQAMAAQSGGRIREVTNAGPS